MTECEIVNDLTQGVMATSDSAIEFYGFFAVTCPQSKLKVNSLYEGLQVDLVPIFERRTHSSLHMLLWYCAHAFFRDEDATSCLVAVEGQFMWGEKCQLCSMHARPCSDWQENGVNLLCMGSEETVRISPSRCYRRRIRLNIARREAAHHCAYCCSEQLCGPSGSHKNSVSAKGYNRTMKLLNKHWKKPNCYGKKPRKNEASVTRLQWNAVMAIRQVCSMAPPTHKLQITRQVRPWMTFCIVTVAADCITVCAP